MAMKEPTHDGFENRVAGVLVPLFALRGANDLGCGDTGALCEFISWAADAGFRVVQLLPVNETGADNSPYNAISSVAIEPTTIDVTALDDLQPEEIESVAGRHRAGELRQGPVNWRTVKALKRGLLRLAFANFSRRSGAGKDGRARSFTAFTEEEAAWLDGYALFRLMMELHGSEKWDAWPEEVRNAASARRWLKALPPEKRTELEQELLHFKYVQWLAFTQWREVRAYATAHGVQLMGDVPIGVNYYSADVWSAPDLFDLRWSCGAPPEPAFLDDEFIQNWGQNWGVPLYRWSRHRATDFKWWRQRVRKIREGFHIFRIDHVLGFFRIYAFPWRPERNAEFFPLAKDEAKERTRGELPRFHDYADDTPAHCDANRAQGEALLAELQDEAGAGALVGEDLGTVPDYVRPSLLSLDIPGFKVPLWEAEADMRLTPGDQYPRCSVATFATHDHDPLSVTWEKWMSVIRAALNEPERLGAARNVAWRESRRLAAWAGVEVPCITPFEDVHERLLAGLFRSNSWLAAVMITDLLGIGLRFNVPGSVGDGNWSARLPEGWQVSFRDKVRSVSRLIRETGR